jgi:hypothetical protein
MRPRVRRRVVRCGVAATVVAVALLGAGCAAPPVAPGLSGKPVGEFFDDVKTELRQVHWRVRSDRVACGTGDARAVDLRNAAITLDLQRIAEASVDGSVRLVAIPLGAAAVAPFGSATASRKWSQEIVVKLDVAGPSRVYDATSEPTATDGSLARTLNAAIDGFVRSSSDEPCIRLAALRLTLVVDVRRQAGGGFKLVVPATELAVDASGRDVNTLTLSWDKIESNALR